MKESLAGLRKTRKTYFFYPKATLWSQPRVLFHSLSYLEPSSTLERYLLLVQCVGPRMEAGKSTRRRFVAILLTLSENITIFAPSFPTTFFFSSQRKFCSGSYSHMF